MKIPYIISNNAFNVYLPSSQTLELIGEGTRKIVAENFNWDNSQCPSLKEFCIQSIAENFKEKHLLNEITCSDKVALLDVLAVDLPLELVIPLVNEEHYWKRRYSETFGTIHHHLPEDWTWKKVFLERYVQKLIEEAEPQYNDEETFNEILDLCCPYVSCVYIDQLRVWKPPLTMEKEDIPEEYPIEHINLMPICKKLSNIEELHISYGMKNVGEDFTWNMFKVSVSDCQKLGKALLELRNLRHLSIHRSPIGFKHCQALVQGLVKHKTLEELDLSNCEIGDAGALCIAYYIIDGSSLTSINLANNQVGKIGAEGLGFAILSEKCETLSAIDLKMNPLGTDGTMGIMRALVRCSKIKRLSFAACVFDEDTPLKICQMLKLNESLKQLDISSNWFGNDGGDSLVDAVSVNTTIEWLDYRETDISQEQCKAIDEYLIKNRNKEAEE
ncbi:uncharacterized protein LOC143191121 [Rhynchophorus ferrugineus]|uniref:uncharacterized protein LOC143191121 n=1 Tax=Rhynchophorus ferrugineus TaxID=354439 RepID=UPI003FCDC6EC